MIDFSYLVGNFYDLTPDYVCVVSLREETFFVDHANKLFSERLIFQQTTKLEEHIHQEDTAYIIKSLKQLNSSNPTIRFTCRFRSKYGWQELDVISKLTLENTIVCTGRELLDICDFCENGPLPLHKVETDGNILWANKAELKYLGYERDEYIGHNIATFMLNGGTVLPPIFEELIGNGFIKETKATLITKTGEHRNTLTDSNLRYRDGNIHHTRCYLRDNTTMLNTSWKLHNQEEKYNVLQQSAADVIIEMNTHGYITKYNAAAATKFPIQLDDCFFQFLNKDCEYVKDQFEKALTNRNIQFEFQDESLCSYSASFIPIATKESISHGNYRENKCIFLVAHDITDKLRAKEIAETNYRQRTQLLCQISHEIRTPMNGIVGIAQILLDEHLPIEISENIEIIFNCASTLHSMLNNVLDFNKIESGNRKINLEPINVSNIISNAMNVFQAGAKIKGVQLEWSVSEFVANNKIVSDELCLSQITMNLVSNAVKFTEKGRVTVTVNERKISNKNIELVLSVLDTGIGIANEHRDKLFHAFVQVQNSAKYGGTGLGLTICKQLIEMLGGTITLDSTVGIGTIFTVTLPVEISDVTTKSEKKIKLADSCALTEPKYRKILVAEDNVVNQKVVVTFLKKLNFDSDIAVNGNEAIELLQKNKYDIVLMDCQMPECDGFEATMRIREFDKQMIIVALTADVVGDSKQKCLSAGMDEFLSKPMTIEKLRAVLTKFFVL